ncbi:hypothetical protein V6Z12_D08G221300 [Gossypium hirsutum]
MKSTSTVKGRRKIELSCGSDTSFSFRIVDSLCNSEEESLPRGRDLVMYVGSNLNLASSSSPYLESCSSDDFIEFCLSSDNKMDISFGFKPDDDAAYNPHKPLEGDSFSRTSSRANFSPIRKMLDPLVKSKSPPSPLGYLTVTDADNVDTSVMGNTRRNKTCRKSLLHDFSHNAESDFDFFEKDNVHSPIHLHGCLKLGAKHGVPFFEFSMNEPGDVFLAKTLKANNGFNWVYTFHSVGNKKKTNAGISGPSDNSSKDAASIIAQMQVSSRLCSEMMEGGEVDNSVVTEFVLYDIARAKQRVTVLGSTDVHKAPACSNVVTLKDHLNHACDSDEVEFINGPPAKLHPNLEIAAIVIQVPFKNRESLKYRRGDKIDDRNHSNLLNVSMTEESKSTIQDSRSKEKVKVVIPTGNHGFPCAGTRGPSSLLDRWRFGGGCDCGGWDMACPLVVFGNTGLNCFEDRPLVDNEQPFQLFHQGAKESTPALTMMAIEGGYAIDFHAKLSALQAFSICVAVLHCTETSAAATGEIESKHSSQYNSLKMLIEEEVKSLIKAVTEEETKNKKKKKVSKKVEAIPPSYVINPPFSPIARV